MPFAHFMRGGAGLSATISPNRAAEGGENAPITL
jgi:hypothetical protein